MFPELPLRPPTMGGIRESCALEFAMLDRSSSVSGVVNPEILVATQIRAQDCRSCTDTAVNHRTTSRGTADNL